MQLWTEYVGHTMAGQYPIGELLRSEGRNAFFVSRTETGEPATLRVTEALNDESELIDRWSKAAAVSNPHLLRILKSGRTELDGVPLAYAVIEASDASLAEVLVDRVLTVEETEEVALAVIAALKALHGADLVHEHVEAANVYAVGEVIKLRSDCVRECVGDFEADTPEAREALRRRDVHDLGLLLLRCLSLQRAWTTDAKLPAPFQRVVACAVDGSWGLAEMEAALVGPQAVPAWIAAPPTTPPAAVHSVEAAATFRSRPVTPPTAVHSVEAAASFRPRPAASSIPQGKPAANIPVLSTVEVAAARRQQSAPPERVDMRRILLDMAPRKGNGAKWAGLAAAAVLLFALFWNIGGNHHAAAVPKTSPVPQAAPQPAQPLTAKPGAGTPAWRSTTTLAAMGARSGFHVIAYTYNYEQQARAKVSALQRNHFSLQPQVFTPTGGAPYFVALGNTLDEEGANALRQRARRAGLPRDTYVRAF